MAFDMTPGVCLPGPNICLFAEIIEHYIQVLESARPATTGRLNSAAPVPNECHFYFILILFLLVAHYYRSAKLRPQCRPRK
jgi:hypothetical protein